MRAVEIAAAGDLDAANFLSEIFRVCFTWDDLIDKDVEVSDEKIDQAFEGALLRLPNNPFYLRNYSFLHPLVMTSIANWHVSNELRKDEATSKVSWLLRASYNNLTVMVGLIRGGMPLAREVGRVAWSDFCTEGESLETYLERNHGALRRRSTTT